MVESFYVSHHLSALCQDPDTAALDETERITITEQSCWLNSMETKHLCAYEKLWHPSAVSTCIGPALPLPLGSCGGSSLRQAHPLGHCTGALPSPFAGHGIILSS